MSNIELYQGDCLELMKNIPDLYWIKNGTIKAVKPLKDYRISEEEVERLKTTYKGEKENEKN